MPNIFSVFLDSHCMRLTTKLRSVKTSIKRHLLFRGILIKKGHRKLS